MTYHTNSKVTNNVSMVHHQIMISNLILSIFQVLPLYILCTYCTVMYW